MNLKVIPYKEPKQKELRNSVCDWMGLGYQTANKLMKSMLNSMCDTASITTDLWTSCATDQMELKDIPLCIEPIKYPHTAIQEWEDYVEQNEKLEEAQAELNAKLAQLLHVSLIYPTIQALKYSYATENDDNKNNDENCDNENNDDENSDEDSDEFDNKMMMMMRKFIDSINSIDEQIDITAIINKIKEEIYNALYDYLDNHLTQLFWQVYWIQDLNKCMG
ncbi:hypothetical protein GLOIN_2v1870118 [Rhizophagus irregularis DAOM 181602=DAOM 197198]|nr:hypothetical protein GLOIN_2v1870118 [Rhizophagus irregularis DAOM 181602=DAOM 197198]